MPMSPYLTGLRAKVGTDLLLMPAAGIAVFDDEGRLLLARHVDTGSWATVGGGMEPDERPADVALREVHEETGLLAEVLDIIGAYGGPEFTITYLNGDRVSYMVAVYGGRLLGGEVVLETAELLELGWFTEDEATGLTLDAHMREIVPDAFRWWARREHVWPTEP
jgi:8-oxo-dGTP pyrophosphatase MutT (NUDIX family)